MKADTKPHWTEEDVEGIARRILEGVRTASSIDSIHQDKLPGWLAAANVRAGWINRSLVVALEDAQGRNDEFNILGDVQADTAVLLNMPSITPRGWVIKFSGRDRITYSAYGEGSPPLMSMPYGAAWSDVGLETSHGPILVFGLSFQMDTSVTDTSPGLMRHVPVALYVYKDRQYKVYETAEWFISAIIKQLIIYAESSTGEAFAHQRARVHALVTTKERSVIVMGAYSGSDLEELKRVRDYLTQMGYDAKLISDLPEIPTMSNSDKVRLWTQASRFSVMVDRTASGHLAEFEMLLPQRSILALLRTIGQRSTYMIGDEHLVDVNFIQLFEFATSPLQVLDEVVEWAEAMVGEREQAYNATYPWRKSD